MDRRTHEGPMDFEYQNGTGPMDKRSPFAQISMNSQRPSTNSTDSAVKKRGLYAAFGSPSKPVFPSLREPASSQTHLFSSSSTNLPSSSNKHLPPTPFSNRNNPLFSTPRKLDVDSSGGETPKSPEHADDTDATPDQHMNYRSAVTKFDDMTMPSFTAGDKPVSPKKDKRRDSWWSRAAGLVHSPGRSEGARAVYSDKIVKRVSKKRKNKALSRLRRDSVSDSEASEVAISPRKTSGSRKAQEGMVDDQRKGPHWMYTFFDFLTTHPTLPHILSWYAQLTLNVCLFSGIMYILWSFWSTIKGDVDKRSSEAMNELLAEMAICAQQYTENRCARDSRVPAMETVCNNWEKCMNRDPSSVGRARVSAHTFAEIFNSFLEPISYKAMIFSLILVFGCVALSNLPFSMFRHKAEQAAANHHHYYGNGMPPPPTPHRQFSNPIDSAPYWTPHHGNDQSALEPAPSGYNQIDGQGSPVRRLQFR